MPALPDPLRTAAGRAVLRAGGARRRGSWAAWGAQAAAQLRRAGAGLELEAAGPPDLDGWPRLRLLTAAGAPGPLTLRLGQRVRIGRGVRIVVEPGGPNLIAIGDDCIVDDFATLHVKGGRITMGARCQVRERALLKSAGELRMGDQVVMARGIAVHCDRAITIETMAGFAEHVTLVDSEHLADGSDEYFMDRPVKFEPVRVGRNTFVATGVTITRGVDLGRNCVVAAHAVVRPGTYPDGHLVAGAPAVARRPLPGARPAG